MGVHWPGAAGVIGLGVRFDLGLVSPCFFRVDGVRFLTRPACFFSMA
ncbi:MAG: hypothetical protein ABI427_01655 [Solirubrobacteraceae bacterium]